MGDIRKIDTAREVQLRRALYCGRRDPVLVVGEIAAAVGQLHKTAQAWTAIHPRTIQVESVQHAVVGLGRLLAELRALGGPSDAA